MKSLQNEYNLIKEGKGNKELFIKEARTLFPNIVTNVLTFDQAIHNLNERGIISEGFTGELSQRAGEPNWFKIFSENTEAVKATLKDTDKAVVEKETAGYNYEDKKNNNNISTEQILNGYYVEMKDLKNADKTEDELKKIVFKNLEKDPMYYIKDGAFGIKGIGYTQDAPGLGATKEVTGKYKSSGMEPVKLNEGINDLTTFHKGSHSTGRPDFDKMTADQIEAYLEKDKDKAGGLFGRSLSTVEYILKKKREEEKLKEVSIHDPIGSRYNNPNAKSQIDIAREILADAGVPEEEIQDFVMNNVVVRGRLSDKAREYVSSMKLNPEEGKLKEVSYGSSDGDYEADQEAEQMAYYYYDKGLEAYSEGDFLKAGNFRRTALRYGSYVGWNDTELPPYDKSHSLEEAIKKRSLNENSGEISQTDWQWVYDWTQSFAKKWADSQGISLPLDLKRMFKQKGILNTLRIMDKEGSGSSHKFSEYPKVKKMFGLEEASTSTANELASYIGILQKQIKAEDDPKKLKMLKQDLEDTKEELAKKKSKKSIKEYTGGRIEVPRNYGMDFDEEDGEDDEDQDYYDEEGNIIPLRSPLHPNNRNMRETTKKLKEGYGMSLEDAMREAYKESLNGHVVHVEDTGDSVFFEVSDFYDSETTVVSFEDGRKFNDSTAEYDMSEAKRKGRATMPNKQKSTGSRTDNNMTGNKEALSEAKKRAIDKHLAEIDKLGEVAALEYKMGKVQEKIEELKNRLTMTESDDMKDMVDKKAIGEIKKDIAYLEKTKKMYEGKKAKAARKVSGHTAKPQAAHREEVLDEAQAPVWEQAMKSVLKKRGY